MFSRGVQISVKLFRVSMLYLEDQQQHRGLNGSKITNLSSGATCGRLHTVSELHRKTFTIKLKNMVLAAGLFHQANIKATSCILCIEWIVSLHWSSFNLKLPLHLFACTSYNIPALRCVILQYIKFITIVMKLIYCWWIIGLVFRESTEAILCCCCPGDLEWVEDRCLQDCKMSCWVNRLETNR